MKKIMLFGVYFGICFWPAAFAAGEVWFYRCNKYILHQPYDYDTAWGYRWDFIGKNMPIDGGNELKDAFCKGWNGVTNRCDPVIAVVGGQRVLCDSPNEGKFVRTRN